MRLLSARRERGAQSNVDVGFRAELLRRDGQHLAAVDDCDRPIERRFDPLTRRFECQAAESRTEDADARGDRLEPLRGGCRGAGDARC